MTSPISIAAESDEDAKSGQEWPELDSKSLTDDILSYEYSNGRRYHAFQAGAYLLPNDEAEQERLDMFHHLWKVLLGGALVRTQLNKPARILDIGTGTGSWAMEAADLWPMATVIGTDLSPIQPSLVPTNCHFFVDDAESTWDWEPFDFIHGRSLCGSIRDWPRFYRQCFKNLKPGGRLEMQEHDAWVNCAPSGRVPPFIANWNVELNAAFWAWGKGLNVADKHVKWMKDAGFVDVDDQIHQCPIGPWARDARVKEMGKWFLVHMLAAVEPYTLEIYTRVLGKTLAETQIAIEMVKKELREKKNHLCARFHFITARKPDR